MAITPAKTETLEIRVNQTQKALVRKASEIRGQSMTEFVLSTLEPVARNVVEQDEQIRLSRQAWEDFILLTENNIPATPTAKREAAVFIERFKQGA